jgi:hypothetical protein
MAQVDVYIQMLIRELYDQEASSGGPSIYAPADLNRNITKIFGRLIDIYRGKCTKLSRTLIDCFNISYFLLKPWEMTEDHLAITRPYR